MKSYLLRQAMTCAEPVGFVWVCLILLTILLWWKRQRGFATATAFLAAFIFVMGATGVPGWMLSTLERPWAGLKLEQVPRADAVVLLGGGFQPSRYEVDLLHLTIAGDRHVMALEMIRQGKAPVLIVGGGAVDLDGVHRVEADMVKQYIDQRGLAKSAEGGDSVEVISLGQCANTHDEAVRVAALAGQRGWKRVLLVTSANHMRRSRAAFRSAGVDVFPVPCNFLTTVSTAKPPPGIGVPRADGFNKVAIWMHEKVGWLVYRRLGWITDAEAAAADGFDQPR